jgi:DNA-binding transcriptional LysR family regulator
MQAVPEAIASLARTRPGCRFDLEVHGRDTIAGMMQAHRFDVVFTVVGGTETKGLTVEPLCTIRAVCVAHRASPLARLETVSPADLAGEPFISLAPSYLSRERVDEVFRRAGVFPHIFMTTQTAISACSVIRAGHGAAVLDPLTAYHALGEELCVRRFEPRVDFDYVAAFAHRGLARPLVRTAIEAVRERMQAVSSAMDRLVSQGI